MKRILLLGLCSLALTHSPMIDDNDSVSSTLFALGEPTPEHFISEIDAEKIWRGESLIKYGKATAPDGSKGHYISKYYTCTSCHNTQREDPNLAVVDQDTRLGYATINNIPYLQGSTFWGMVNRETWYNDDYVLKYGDLVTKAEKSLKESIKLCATVCSQGRDLEDWEMESILAYFWSLEIKIKDLDLSKEELEQLNSRNSSNEDKIALIKSKFLLKSPATFAEPPTDKKTGYGLVGNPKLGKAIYQLGCQHCHRPQGESDVIFDDTDLTYNWLKTHMFDNSEKSIYQIIRKGTYSEFGHKEYMPHYTLEKMSDQQIEHLRAFIEHPDQAEL